MENDLDLISLISVIGCFFALLSVMVTMFLYIGNKIDNLRKEMYDESRDFHGRLVAIEERRIKILEK